MVGIRLSRETTEECPFGGEAKQLELAAPAVIVENDTGETCFVAAGAGEGIQLCCCRCTMVFLLSALLLMVIGASVSGTRS